MQRIKAITIFIIGIAVVASGTVIFLFYPEIFGENYRTYSFAMMIVGLLLVAVGSVRGKKKLVEHKMKKDPFEKMLKKMDKEKKKSLSKRERVENEKFFQKLGFRPSFSKEGIGSGKGKQKVVRVLICPNCGAENPETHSFCSECGKLIKAFRKPPKSPDIQAIRGMVKTGGKGPEKKKGKKSGGSRKKGKKPKPVKKASSGRKKKAAKKSAKKPAAKKASKKAGTRKKKGKKK